MQVFDAQMLIVPCSQSRKCVRPRRRVWRQRMQASSALDQRWTVWRERSCPYARISSKNRERLLVAPR